MIDDYFFKLARKMLATVSAPKGIARNIPVGFWNRLSVWSTRRNCALTPQTTEIKLAFIELQKNGVVRFSRSDDNIIIEVL